MRRHEQLSLEQPYIEHSHSKELATISQILSVHPAIAELVGQDLIRDVTFPHTGARGMSGDQVLRVLLLKQMNGFSYRELEFHLADSVTYRTFCRFGALEPTPTRLTPPISLDSRLQNGVGPEKRGRYDLQERGEEGDRRS
jgi:IS5 family transposase